MLTYTFSSIRPFELVFKLFQMERRKIRDDHAKIAVIEARIKEDLECRRTADKIILVTIKREPRLEGQKNAIMRRKATIEQELEGFFEV